MSVLVVVAHPDDEVIGCGGAIAKHVESGQSVTVVTFTDGCGARGDNPEAATIRDREQIDAAGVLGVTKSISIGGWRDQRLDTVPVLELAREVERIVGEEKPSTVYTHWRGDLNQDHCAVASAVRIACRPYTSHGAMIGQLLAFEIPESTAWGDPAFVPNLYVHLSEAHMQKKIWAMIKYTSELRFWRDPEALKVRMQMRGREIGRSYAEAFAVVWAKC